MPWHEYRDHFLTDERIAAGVDFWTAASRAPRRDRAGERRRAARDRRHHRRRDLLRPHHRPLPRARRARDAGLRLPAAQQLLPRRTRAVPAAGARGTGSTSTTGARLLRRRHGRGAVHAAQLPRLCGGRRRRRQARPLGQLGRRHRERRELPRRARLARRRAGRCACRPVVSASPTGWCPDKLAPDTTVKALRDRGPRASRPRMGDKAPALFIRVDGDDGPELRAGFHNFGVITRYNRSVLYALAVQRPRPAHRPSRVPAAPR